MNPVKAIELIDKRMLEHGLLAKGWTFNLSNTRAVIATCRHKTKVLKFSLGWIIARSQGDVEQTVLHEIAHALVPRGCKSHGATWHSKAKEIGFTRGRATYRTKQGEQAEVDTFAERVVTRKGSQR